MKLLDIVFERWYRGRLMRVTRLELIVFIVGLALLFTFRIFFRDDYVHRRGIFAPQKTKSETIDT